MSALVLEVKTRDAKDSADILRKRGAVPAVFYGPKEKTTPIAVNAQKLEHVWKEAGETTIITLKGLGENKDTLIHDAQFHPVSGKLLHMDFYVLEKGKKIKIKVPLKFAGSAPAEKAGHVVVKTLYEVEIQVTPQELPHSLSIDLSKLENVGDHITVKEIALPPSASLITYADEIVASVKEFKEEKVETAPPLETIITTEKKPEEGVPAEGSAPVKEEKKEKKE